MTDQHDTSQTGEQHGGWTGGSRRSATSRPRWSHYTDKVLFDEVWEREGLSKRDRSLITVAALTALGQDRPAAVPLELRPHQRRHRAPS